MIPFWVSSRVVGAFDRRVLFSGLTDPGRELRTINITYDIIKLHAIKLTGDLVITNHHVVAEASDVVAYFSDGTPISYTGRHWRLRGLDIEILLFNVEGAPTLRLQSDQPEEGEHVIVIGNPEGFTGTVTEGIVSGIREDGNILQISAPISPGSSGSPVMDDHRNVVGVAVGGYAEGENLNFAVSTRAIIDGLNELASAEKWNSNRSSKRQTKPGAAPVVSPKTSQQDQHQADKRQPKADPTPIVWPKTSQ